jgi:hypothetical protein
MSLPSAPSVAVARARVPATRVSRGRVRILGARIEILGARIGRTRALGLVLGLALLATPTAAAATSLDVASTRAYVRADNALTHSAKAHLHVAEVNIKALTARIGRECPRIALGAPQDPEAELLYEEIVAGVTHMVYHADITAILRFANTAAGLRWSNPRVTRIVHGYASRLRGLGTLALPDICADTRSWVASGYTVLPAATTLAVQQLKASEGAGPMELSAGLLHPYERPDESRQIAETARLEAGLQEAEATHGTGYLSKIEGLMGLNP